MKNVKKVSLSAGIILLVVICLFLTVTAFLYQKIFDRRFEAYDKPLALAAGDFPDLEVRPVIFKSGKDELSGNFYRVSGETDRKEALIIFCHGFSNGSRDYLSQIHFFAAEGYEVLAYDNTGCHNSTGEGVRGMPQAVINLSDVLRSLSTDSAYGEYHQKPIVLMGHSWGGYAVNAVLAHDNYENVKAVVSFSAPNRSIDMLMEQGKALFGNGIYLLKPFVWAVERFKFGGFAGYSSLDGVNHTAAYVIAFHSRDDAVVSFQNSLVNQMAETKNPNTEAVIMENRGHKVGVSAEARAYEEYLEYYAKSRAGGGEISVSQLENLLSSADKMQLYQLDETVMEGVAAFLDACLGDDIDKR